MKSLRYVLQDRAQLPEQLDWLTPDERARFAAFRFDKRRQDWLLGRWAAKRALLELAGLPQSDIARFEVLSAASGAPIAKLDGDPYDVGLSISHSHGRAFSIVSNDIADLGCDIEFVEPRSAAFVDTFFTTAERDRVERAEVDYRDILITMIWSAKESTLKVLGTGLRADTRSVEVTAADDGEDQGWSVARIIVDEADEFFCLWRLNGKFVLTVAARDRVAAPNGQK